MLVIMYMGGYESISAVGDQQNLELIDRTFHQPHHLLAIRCFSYITAVKKKRGERFGVSETGLVRKNNACDPTLEKRRKMCNDIVRYSGVEARKSRQLRSANKRGPFVP